MYILYMYLCIYIYIRYPGPHESIQHPFNSPPHLGTQLPNQVVGTAPHVEILEGLASVQIGQNGEEQANK